MFGVGATKAGTSWLYSYLAGHPQCHLRSVKELHFFDAIDEGRRDKQAAQFEAEREMLTRRAETGAGSPEKRAERAQRIADLGTFADVLRAGDEAAYLAYLEAGAAADSRLIADITPGYALLSEGRLKRMAAMAPDTRFVYLLRDPVERLWSHVRMIARRRAATGEDITERAGRILRRVLRGEEDHIARRGDYRAVLGRLRAAVAPSRLFTAFYEELFSDQGVARLCAFLGLSPAPAPLAERVHEGVPVPMSDAQRRAAADWLRPQYDYVAASLGPVPSVWRAHMAGV